jgi:hypothetical protein
VDKAAEEVHCHPPLRAIGRRVFADDFTVHFCGKGIMGARGATPDLFAPSLPLSKCLPTRITALTQQQSPCRRRRSWRGPQRISIKAIHCHFFECILSRLSSCRSAPSQAARHKEEARLAQIAKYEEERKAERSIREQGKQKAQNRGSGGGGEGGLGEPEALSTANLRIEMRRRRAQASPVH